MFQQDGPIAGPRQCPCSQCGGQVTFAPGATLTCTHCGATQDVPRRPEDIAELDYTAHLARLESAARTEDVMAVHCAGCGADVQPAADVLATVCPFCGGAIVGTPRPARHMRPSGVLPFATTADQAHGHLRGWLAGLWFAPRELAARARQVERFSGLYVPYWVFSCVATSFYSGRRGTHTVDGNGHSHVRWQHVVGWVKDVLTFVRVVASRSIPAHLAGALEPWDLARLEPYDEAYLSGFHAEHHHTSLAEGFAAARVEMDHRMRVSAMADMGGDHQEIKTIKSQYDDVKFQLVLMPVWVCAYHYGDRLYQVLVNGRTGEVVGDRPYGAIKVAAAALSALAVVCAVGWAVMWCVTRGQEAGLIN